MQKLIMKRRHSEEYLDSRSFAIIIIMLLTIINTITFFGQFTLPFIDSGRGLQYIFNSNIIIITVLTVIISASYYLFYRMIQNDKYVGFLYALLLFVFDIIASSLIINNHAMKMNVPILKIIFFVILTKSFYHSIRSALLTRKINKEIP